MDDFIANTINGTCMLFINLELQLLIGINRLTPMSDQNFSLQYQYNMKKIDENKIHYGDSKSIQYQILHTNIMGIVWQIVRRIVNMIL